MIHTYTSSVISLMWIFKDVLDICQHFNIISCIKTNIFLLLMLHAAYAANLVVSHQLTHVQKSNAHSVILLCYSYVLFFKCLTGTCKQLSVGLCFLSAQRGGLSSLFSPHSPLIWMVLYWRGKLDYSTILMYLILSKRDRKEKKWIWWLTIKSAFSFFK